MIKKSILAALLIGLGNYALLTLGNPIGPFLFSLGLMTVCVMGANLFTGKCGFFFEDKIPLRDLSIILVVNLLAGYGAGLLFSLVEPSLISSAAIRAATWTVSLPYLLKSFLCGVVMYVAVKMYKKGSVWGILLGVPLFLFCGWQHSIANIITLGIARTFNPAIFLCVLGNFAGSLTTSFLLGEKNGIQKV